MTDSATVKRQRECRHEFHDTAFCVKCDWVPPPDYAATLRIISDQASRLARAVSLLHACIDDPVNGVALAKIYLEEIDPGYVKPTF